MMMIRSMAPDIIAFDEIDPFGELDEIKYGLTCGITYVTTIHGKSYYDIKNKSLDNLFERYIILDNKYPYNVSLICDRSGNTIYERS